MRDRALIVAEFPAKSFILNRRRGRSRGPGIVEEGFGEGKGWGEGVRATGSSINSREMQASLADSPLVFSSAFERSFDGLTGPFLTWFPASCIRVFPLSRHREMEEEEEGARFGPEKNIFDTRVRKALRNIYTATFYHPLFRHFEHDAYICARYSCNFSFIRKERGERGSFIRRPVQLIVPSFSSDVHVGILWEISADIVFIFLFPSAIYIGKY